MKYFSLVVKQPTISPIQKCICFLNIDKKKMIGKEVKLLCLTIFLFTQVIFNEMISYLKNTK